MLHTSPWNLHHIHIFLKQEKKDIMTNVILMLINTDTGLFFFLSNNWEMYTFFK